jgi:hypothetical protein
MVRVSKTLVRTCLSLVAISFAGIGCGGGTNANHDAARDSAIPDQAFATAGDLSLDVTDGPGSVDGGAISAKDTSPRPDVPQTDSPAVGSTDLSSDRPLDVSPKSDSNVVVDGSLDTGTGDALALNGDVPIDSGVGGDIASGLPNKFGLINLLQALPSPLAPSGTVFGSGAAASFGLVTENTSCDPVTSGDCQLHDCPPSLDAGAKGTGSKTPSSVPAGTVTITGLATELSLAYNATAKSYYSPSIGTPLWTASRSATLVVTGSADVPAFSATLVAPNPISVTSPVAQSGSSSTGMAYTISRASSLNVTWTGGVDGTATVNLGDSNSVSVVCSVDAAKGTLTVPAAFMAKLGSSGSFSVSTNSTMTKNVGDWLMQFDAMTVKDSGTATFTP